MKNSFLITGGTGSFGKEFVKFLVANKKASRIVIYSRDELKQYEMSQTYPKNKFPYIRFFLGDVRDQRRLSKAMEDIDTVIHAAALKQVPTTEYNPFECIKTNVIGANNVIEAALENKVKSVLALSTDKACSPINLYGATKLCSDKLFISANNIKGKRNIKFFVVRYGNVMGSRGSVIPLFLKLSKNNSTLPITDVRMTRFNITLEHSIRSVLWALQNLIGGELLIPKLPSYKILDLAKSFNNSKIKITGIRPGEKIHEEMISESDSLNTISIKDYYIILPNLNSNLYKYYKKKFKGKFVKQGFIYNSNKNKEFLTSKELNNLIKKIRI